MTIRDALLVEYDHETGTTRKLLDRLPEDRLAWQPHARSMTLGGLATHLSNIPDWGGPILDELSFDLANLPPRLEARMGDQLLAVLDKHYLRPSRLDPARRGRISDRFDRAAATSAPGIRYRLEVRATRSDEVNAMALPGGVIILLDGLVEFAGDDDAVLGVLGHELGHVVHKHSARQILQSIGLGALAGLLWGDFSGVAASVPVTLKALHSSREFEGEADEFAITLLRAQGVSVGSLSRFFVRLRARQSRRGVGELPDFLSTHPATQERIDRFRRAN